MANNKDFLSAIREAHKNPRKVDEVAKKFSSNTTAAAGNRGKNNLGDKDFRSAIREVYKNPYKADEVAKRFSPYTADPDASMQTNPLFDLDDEILQSVGSSYRSQWGSKYYYDVLDPDDYQRAQNKAMPKYLDEYYDMDDPVDRYLYDNGLPYKSAFSDMYSQAALDRDAKEGERRAYADKYKTLQNEVYSAWTSNPDEDKEQVLYDILTSGKYDDVAKNLAEPNDDADFYDMVVGYNKKSKNPDAFTLDDLLTGYDAQRKENTLRNWASAGKAAQDASAQDTAADSAAAQIDVAGMSHANIEQEIARIDARLKEIKPKGDILAGGFYDALDPDYEAKSAERAELEQLKAVLRKISSESQVREAEAQVAEQYADTPTSQIGAEGLTVKGATTRAQRKAIARISGDETVGYSAAQAGQAAYEAAHPRQESGEPRRKTQDEYRQAAEEQLGYTRTNTFDRYYTADFMTDEERGKFNHLAENEGAEAALAYFGTLEPVLNKRNYLEAAAIAATNASNSPVTASVVTVLAQPEYAMDGFNTTISGGLFELTKGKLGRETVYNDPRLRSAFTKDRTRGNITENITATNGQLLGALYGMGMSVADNAARMLTFGQLGAFGTAASAATMYGQVAASTVSEYMQKGASSKQALFMGVLAGGAEALGEAINMSALMKIKDAGALAKAAGGKIGASKLVSNYLITNGITEFGSESVTEVANYLADWLVMQDESKVMGIYDAAKKGGATEGGAFFEVVKQIGGDSLVAGVGGLVSGLLLGGGQLAMTTYNTGEAAGATGMSRFSAGAQAMAENVSARSQLNDALTGTYRELAENGTAAPAEVRMRVAEDLQTIGLSEQEAETFSTLFDKYASSPNEITSEAGRASLDAFVKNVTAAADVSKGISVDKDERVDLAKQRLTPLYDGMMDYLKESEAALRSGDLNAHSAAMGKLTDSIKRYQSAFSAEKTKENAAVARDQLKQSKANRAVTESVQSLAANEGRETAHQQQRLLEAAGAESPAEADMGSAQENVGAPSENPAEAFANGVNRKETLTPAAADGMMNANTNGGDFDGGQGQSGSHLGTERVLAGDQGSTAAADHRPGASGPIRTARQADRGAGKKASAPQRAQRLERQIAASESASDDIDAAVNALNERAGETVVSADDFREAENVADDVHEALDKLRDITGRDVILYASENENAPEGFTRGGAQYAKDNGLYAVFHAAHEDAHNMPNIIKALRTLMDEGYITNGDLNDYARARAENIARVRGAQPIEDRQKLKREFACDLFGAVMYARLNKDSAIFASIGVSDEVARQAERAVLAALAYAPEVEHDLDVELSENAEAAGDVEFSESITGNYDYSKSFAEQVDRWFGKSKVVNEDGTPRIVYHGSNWDPLMEANGKGVFDMSKGRSSMDIQGAFFSPWEDDARGYGRYVNAYYLSITNPASEQVAYAALRRFQGQNYAGKKAREYLISLGYDGVNNGNEEYIAFYPEQIKSATDNIGTFDGSNPDIRFSTNPLHASPELRAAMDEARKLFDSGVGHLEYYNRQEADPRVGRLLYGLWDSAQKVDVLDQALKLYRAGKSAVDYYNDNPDEYNPQVAKQLQGMQIRNGQAVGGRLGSAELDEIVRMSEQFRSIPVAVMSATAPVRVFEDVAGNGRGKTNEERARNYIAGERMKDTFYEYGNVKQANRAQWMADNIGKVDEAFHGHGGAGVNESVLVQLSGMGITSDEQTARAVYDRNCMIVEALDGVFVFDGKGRIKAMCDSQTSVIYKDDLAYAVANKGKSAPPQATKGRLSVTRSGDSVKVTDRQGNVIAEVRGGKSPNMDAVRATTDALRGFYDMAWEVQNRVMLENGYKPLGKIKNYFPFQQRKAAGIETFIQMLNSEGLPTSINGLTGSFKPGRPWAAHLQQRLGEQTEFDAVGGFNKYVSAAGDVIYNTPVIQRIRQLENALRKAANPSDNINANFVSWLHEYANEWANKKADFDRGAEGLLGRVFYAVSNKLTGLYSASAVGGNVSSAMSNFISYLTGAPGLSKGSVAKESLRTIVHLLTKKDDGFVGKIPFLARRFAKTDKIDITLRDRTKSAGYKALYFLFSLTDRYSVEAVARAKYADCREQGMAEDAAIKATDDFCIKNFADRGKGQSARLFNVKWLRPFLQFQLEVTNQMSHFRDIDRDAAGRQIQKLLSENKGNIDGIDFDALGNGAFKGGGLEGFKRKLGYLILLSLYGALTRVLMGRDQTWNAGGMIADAARGYERDGASGALSAVADDVIENAPIIGSFVGGGRIPMFQGVENVLNLGKDIVTGEARADSFVDAASAFVPGGGQARKTWKGISAAQAGGNYTGTGRLRYPIEDGSKVRTAVFGPSAAAPQGYRWGDDVLTKSETEAYEKMVDAGFGKGLSYETLLGYDSSTSAAKALSLLVASEKTGADYTAQEFDLIAEILGLNYDSTKDGTLRTYAEKQTNDYRKKKTAKTELSDKEKENLAAIEAYWDTLVGN